MPNTTFTKLKARREAINRQIEDHKPLPRSFAIKKLRAYAIEYGMTEEDLFPTPVEVEDPYLYSGDSSWPDFDYIDFSEFEYEDTLDYTFIEDLKQQRASIDAKLRAIRAEATTRAHAFIEEYDLAKDDIYPVPRHAKKKQT
jgi:hypothetical protein